MKNLRKILSFALVITMVINLFAGLGMVSTQAQTTGGSSAKADFVETFTGTMNAEWESENYGHVYGGLYHTDRYLVNRYFGAQNTKNYYVQADVTFNRYFDGENYHTGFTGIAARYDASVNTGYELAVGADTEKDKLVLRFAKRVNGELTESRILQSVGQLGDTVTLRLTVYGSVILCYANGRLVYETEDTAFASGVPAIVNGDAQGTYDNFIYSTFAPTGYDRTKTVVFSGDLNRVFANSANWDPNFTFNGILRLEKPFTTNEDIYGNEIEIDENYWDSDQSTTPTVTGTPVYGGILSAAAVAQAGIYTRGDLRMIFSLYPNKKVTLTIFKGDEQLYLNEGLGTNKDFALEITSTDTSVAFAVDGTTMYTYTDAAGLTGATGVEATNAVGSVQGISFTTKDIVKEVVAAQNLLIPTGTALDTLDLKVTVLTLLGNSYTVAPQEVTGFNNTPGDYTLWLKYNDISVATQLHVRNDISKYAVEDFTPKDLTDNGWNSDATDLAVNFASGAYVFDNNDTKYITKSTTWVNAYVQANIALSGTHAESAIATPFAGIFARRDLSTGNGIEFALITAPNTENLAARLYLRGSNTGVGTEEYKTPAVYSRDQAYTLRLEACGTRIKAYIDGELIFDLADGDVDLTSAGVVGICNNGGAATADDFATGMLEDGYFGTEPTATDSAVTAFISAVNALRYTSVAIADADSLESQYAALTAEQKATIPSYVTFKYQRLLVQAEKNTYTGVANSELLIHDDFSDDSKWIATNRWEIKNGKLNCMVDAEFTPSDELALYTTVLHPQNALKGAVTFASAEFTITEIAGTRGGYIGFEMSYSDKGSYHARLSTSNNRLELYRSVHGAAYANEGTKATSSLYSKTTFGSWLGTNYDYTGLYAVGTTFKLTCVITDTQLLLYLNDGKDSTDTKHVNQLVLTYTLDDTDKEIISAENSARFRVLYTRVEIDNFMMMGHRADRMSADEITGHYAEATGTYAPGNYYSDTFENETVSTRPSHWLQNVNQDNWLVKDENQLQRKVLYSQDFSAYAAGSTITGWGSNGVATLADGNMGFKTQSQATYTVPGLAGYTDHTVEAKVKIDESTTISSVIHATAAIVSKNYGFALIKNIENSSVGVRLYDHNANKQLSTATLNIDPTVYHTLKMEFKGGMIACYVDGVRYIYKEDPGTGTVGVIALRPTLYAMYADDVKVTVENDATTGEQVYLYNAFNPQETISWLHVFDPSPIISADIMVDAPAADARVGVMTRYAVENSYVKAGYDFAEQKWFISYTPGVDFVTQTIYADTTSVFAPNTRYRVDLVSTGTRSFLSVNGELVLSTITDYVGYGRVGLFAENTRAAFDNVYSYSPMGEVFSTGVDEQQLYHSGNYSEIEQLEDGTIYASSGAFTWFTSSDDGRSFTSMSNPLPTGGQALGYISTIKVKDAQGNTVGYLSVGADYTASFSADFANWETRGHILPNDAENRTDEAIGMTPENINMYALTHISSFTQVTLDDGTIRIFMPIAFRYYDDNDPSTENVKGHYTRVFYSDDYGYTWTESENDTRDLLKDDGTRFGDDHASSFCEAKIIRCADGSLRMYNTRKWATCVYYAESLDNGVTWSSWGKIESMPCAVSSFGISEDPEAPGTYYMAYVKNVPYSPTDALPRTLLMLVKTTDGKNWEEVMVLDRYTSTKHPLSSELYQFLDPNVLVTEDYIYVGYGRSDSYADSYHNHQTSRFIRVAKAYSVTVDSDMQDVLSVSTKRGLKGDTVTVTVKQPEDAQIKAGTLKAYSTDRKNSMKIITQPTHVPAGTGQGSMFEFTMPAADVVIDAELIENLSTAQTNFSVAVLAASYKTNASDTKDGLRYLSRMYLPQDGKGNLLLDVTYGGKAYTVTGFGSLYAKTSSLGSTILDMAAVNAGIAKVSEAYPNGKLYDLNASFVDFTVRLIGTKAQLQEYYSVRTYLQLEDALGNTVYVYSDDTISRSGLDFQ